MSHASIVSPTLQKSERQSGLIELDRLSFFVMLLQDRHVCLSLEVFV